MMKLEDLLAPLSRIQFLDQHFRSKLLHVPGAIHRVLGAEAFSWATANRLLAMYRVIAPGTAEVGIMRNKARNVPVVLDKRSEITLTFNDTVVQSRVSSHYFDPAALAATMKQGAAVIVNDAHVYDDQIRRLAIAIEDFASARAFCNLYLTSAKERLCEAHVDAHDLFVVHVEGKKTWRFHQFHQPEIPQNINPAQHPEFEAGPVVTEVELSPGDLLYVPWGLAHSVVTHSSAMHLSFGFTPPLKDRPNGARIPRHEFALPRELDAD